MPSDILRERPRGKDTCKGKGSRDGRAPGVKVQEPSLGATTDFFPHSCHNCGEKRGHAAAQCGTPKSKGNNKREAWARQSGRRIIISQPAESSAGTRGIRAVSRGRRHRDVECRFDRNAVTRLSSGKTKCARVRAEFACKRHRRRIERDCGDHSSCSGSVEVPPPGQSGPHGRLGDVGELGWLVLSETRPHTTSAPSDSYRTASSNTQGGMHARVARVVDWSDLDGNSASIAQFHGGNSNTEAMGGLPRGVWRQIALFFATGWGGVGRQRMGRRSVGLGRSDGPAGAHGLRRSLPCAARR